MAPCDIMGEQDGMGVCMGLEGMDEMQEADLLLRALVCRRRGEKTRVSEGQSKVDRQISLNSSDMI